MKQYRNYKKREKDEIHITAFGLSEKEREILKNAVRKIQRRRSHEKISKPLYDMTFFD